MERPYFDPLREREFLSRGWWAQDTLPRWISEHVLKRGDAPALAHGDTVLSWKALQEQVVRVAEGLRRRGVKAGDVVAVQLPNTAEFVVSYLAICRLGAVMCTLHMPYRGAEIETLLRHSRAVAAICLPQSRAMFMGLGLAFEELLDCERLDLGYPAPEAADPFLLLYTSGTTAAPRGVVHAYRTMLGNARLGAPEHRLGAGDRILSAAPLTHLYGLYALHCALAAGACTALLPVFKPDELANAVQKLKPTALWTAPAHVAACRAAGLFDSHDWSSLKLAIVSGSIAPAELVDYVAAKLPGCAVTQLWGMTELQAGLYTRPGDPPAMSAHSAGRPSPGTQARLGEGGELQIRGPLLFSGYLHNEAETGRAFTADGWFRTGDLAERLEGDYFVITGRSKDVINRGGVKFNPTEVERLLDAHPAILQSAIAPMPDPILGEKACAFVTLRPGTRPPTLDQLVEYLLQKNIAKNKLPERLVVVAEMPLTPTRKIIKGRLRLPES